MCFFPPYQYTQRTNITAKFTFPMKLKSARLEGLPLSDLWLRSHAPSPAFVPATPQDGKTGITLNAIFHRMVRKVSREQNSRTALP